MSHLQQFMRAPHCLNREIANLDKWRWLQVAALDEMTEFGKLAPIYRPGFWRPVGCQRGDHDKVEGGGAVEEPVLVVFLRRVRVVARPVDNCDDVSIKIHHV